MDSQESEEYTSGTVGAGASGTGLFDLMVDKLLSIDRFGKEVKFNVDGKQSLGTVKGAILSSVMMLLFLTYSYIKFMDMWEFGDTENKNFIDDLGLDTE